ncbi:MULTISPECIES: hypothetical protein [unclassified Peribacillus]|uniref:hypothetical protein n=1 Tax=unclassified Peribacillus TaxID=2675266 RepID=UPI001914B9BC|nr:MULTISPECIES: hypothetical protein [unclassified Peribacillus]MBK5445390.1 hypothetical protein [Peribacillus sp. TH24]MBK5498077.1 hypothetical protein [Peribacillus sp. TH14]
MFGTVRYFTDFLKAQIMYNFSGEKMISLSENHTRLNKEINVKAKNSKEKVEYLLNLEKAYGIINKEMFGQKEELTVL